VLFAAPTGFGTERSLAVIAADGQNLVPQTVKQMEMLAGQRYDVVVRLTLFQALYFERVTM
jgi:FtsP/CotA-like multicopper oxidase with cupredoxin domain